MPMSSKKPNPCLSVLDVGHGSAAVLRDEGGVVVFDAGKGAHVERYLDSIGVTKVEAMFLSHADVDHIGGAVTLLLNPKVKVRAVFLNPDPTKDTEVFMQLCVALCEAEKRSGTHAEPSLTTNTVVSRKGANIEVLYPPATTALAGVGGRNQHGKRNTSNSLSAAIRITGATNVSVLLGGDVEFDCVDEWKRQGLTPSATALIFPHHGGLPVNVDESEAALFAHEITKLVTPDTIVFSIHRSLHLNPRDKILSAVLKASKKVRFACTQLPDRFHALVGKDAAWCLHRHPSGKGIVEGTVEFTFVRDGLKIQFRDSP